MDASSVPAGTDSLPRSEGGFFGFFWKLLPTLKTPLPNPGKFEDFNQEAHSVLQIAEAFDGVKFELNKGLSPLFAINHNIRLGESQAPAGAYDFGANYVTSDNKTLLVSRIDTTGNLHARAQYQLSPQFLARMQAALVTGQPHASTASLDLDYRGSDWCGSAKVGTHGACGMSYFQSVTPHLALGVGAEYQGRIYGQSRHVSAVSAAARYNTDKFVCTGQLASYGALIASYTQRVQENVNLATEMQLYLGPGARESMVSIGMEYRLRVGSFKSFITSTGHGTAYLERKLNPDVSFVMSGDIEPKKKEYKFGMGLVVGGGQ